MKNLLRIAVTLIGLFFCASACAQVPTLPPFPTDPYLDSWSFYDATNWSSDLGYAPIAFTNIVDDESCWSSDDGVLDCNGLILDTNVPAYLNYNVVENNGHTNLICPAGVLWFWFSPDWSSTNQGGTGPGNWGEFIDAGAWTSNAAVGYWGLSVDPAGDNIYFSGQTNGASTNYFTCPISWSAGSWHLIALIYTPTNSILNVDGQLATNGIGVSYWPGHDVLTNGFWIGSDAMGNEQARGEFVDVETYSDQFFSEYSTNYFYDYYNQMSPEFLGTFGGGFAMDSGFGGFSGDSGGGGSTPSYVDGTNLWLQITGTTSTGTNMTAYFTIWPPAGVTNGVYDLYLTTNLDSDVTGLNMTNWAWVMRCDAGETNLTVTNLTAGCCFFMLGLTNDTDGDGLSDAFEKLVSHTDPCNADQNTNGIPDGWEWNYFRNLNQSATNLDAEGNTLLYDYQNGFNPTILNALIIWPTSGTSIGGSSFTLQARVNNNAATVTAQIVDASGNTNAVQGLVEQSGTVWVQNLPLAAGTNVLTITASDSNGHTNAQVLQLSQSSVWVTLDPLADDQLNQLSVTSSGTVSDPTASVYVNGVQASVDEDGNWEADNVPVAPADAAVFDVEVSGGGSSQQFVQVQPATVVVSSYSGLGQYSYSDPDPYYDFTWDESVDWSYTNGGNASFLSAPGSGGWAQGSLQFLPDGEGFTPPDFYGNDGAPLMFVWEQSALTVTTADTLLQRTNQTHVMIVPAGMTTAGTTNSYLVRACASEFSTPFTYTNLVDGNGWQILFSVINPPLYAGDVPLPPEWLQIQGQTLINSGITNTDGSVWGVTLISATTNATPDVTPSVISTVTLTNNDYTFNVQAVILPLQLAVDANRDGNITFDSADQTTASQPYRFWVNNDYDGYDSSIDDYDDLDPSTGDDATNTTISCTRDLEDYTRLWINTQGIITELQNGTFKLALEWENVSGAPAIRIFPAAETNGGTLYLTDEGTALAQRNAPYGNCIIDSYVGQTEVQGNSPFIIPTSFWSNVSTNQPVVHLLFDAVSRGSGQLVIAIYKNDGLTKLAEAPQPLYLDLQDVKEMYQRWTVDSSGAVATTATAMTSPYPYDSSIPADNNFILFVHGWNLAPWERDAFADTAFKRLYWQGYKGHFGAFQWPTGYGVSGIISAIADADNYDNSEFNAWNSGTGLKNLLTTLNSTYSGHVYLMAHSMGNVVAGEALKQAGTNQLVNTYVAMQGAVPAHCYDASATIRTNYSDGSFNNELDAGYPSHVPNYYASYYTSGAPCYFNGTAGAGSYINFYNSQDWALSYWAVDEDYKPDIASGFSYNYSDNKFEAGGSEIDFPSATYEIFAYCDTAYCFALGAQADVGGVFLHGGSSQQIDLQASFGFEEQHKDHSGEFNSDNMNRSAFWHTIMQRFDLTP